MINLARCASSRTKSSFAHVLRRLSGNQRGSVGVIAAVSLPVLLGFGGLGVDVSLWLRAKNAVQGAADAAASSAAAEATANSSWDPIVAEARGVAAVNGYHNGVNGVVVTLNNPPTSGAYAGNTYAYEVIISAPQQLFLASVLPVFYGPLSAPTVSGRAVALTVPSPTCILALSEQDLADGTVKVNGGAPLNARNCDVDADSPSDKSVNTSGGGSITAKNIRTVGDISGGNITLTGQRITHAQGIADPYARTRSIPPIPAPQPSSQNNWSGRIQNPTGVIAFSGDVNVTGAGATLDPGVYIITPDATGHGGSLKSSKDLSGTGVTIILTGPDPSNDNGFFNFQGSGTLNLTAPATGPTAGIALWADRRLPSKVDSFTGSSRVQILGAIYLPSHNLSYAGNDATGTNCMQLIAYQITITGTSTFNHNCDGVGTLDPPIKWTLVE